MHWNLFEEVAMIQLTPHFTLDEFKCACGCSQHKALQKNLLKLAQQLEIIRAELRGKPLIIISGVRCSAHNATISTHKKSRHLTGEAADFQVAGFTDEDLYEFVKDLILKKVIVSGGLGRYRKNKAAIHYDIRGYFTEWYE